MPSCEKPNCLDSQWRHVGTESEYMHEFLSSNTRLALYTEAGDDIFHPNPYKH